MILVIYLDILTLQYIRLYTKRLRWSEQTEWVHSILRETNVETIKLECDLSSVKIWTMHNVDGKEEVINSRCKP